MILRDFNARLDHVALENNTRAHCLDIWKDKKIVQFCAENRFLIKNFLQHSKKLSARTEEKITKKKTNFIQQNIVESVQRENDKRTNNDLITLTKNDKEQTLMKAQKIKKVLNKRQKHKLNPVEYKQIQQQQRKRKT